VKRSDGESLGGQIKIQDDPHSEAIHTMTKFCSDLKGVYGVQERVISTSSTEARVFNSAFSPAQTRAQKFPLFPPKRVPPTAFARVKRWERIGCKL
jgi:hypothetical protein